MNANDKLLDVILAELGKVREDIKDSEARLKEKIDRIDNRVNDLEHKVSEYKGAMWAAKWVAGLVAAGVSALVAFLGKAVPLFVHM